MEKPFLLIINTCNNPRMGTDDWVGFFKTKALAKAEAVLHNSKFKENVYADGKLMTIVDFTKIKGVI